MTNKTVSFSEIESVIAGFIASNEELLAGIDFIVGVSRGGLVPAALLAAKIDKPLAAVYINKNDEIFFDRKGWVKNKNILVVDDVIRSGKTLWLVKKYLGSNCSPKNISFFALFEVSPLSDKDYSFPVISRKISEEVVFPWDC